MHVELNSIFAKLKLSTPSGNQSAGERKKSILSVACHNFKLQKMPALYEESLSIRSGAHLVASREMDRPPQVTAALKNGKIMLMPPSREKKFISFCG